MIERAVHQKPVAFPARTAGGALMVWPGTGRGRSATRARMMKREDLMPFERRPRQSVRVMVPVVFLALFGAAALAGSDAANLLAARSMTEAQYLERMAPVFRELYGPMALPAAKMRGPRTSPLLMACPSSSACMG